MNRALLAFCAASALAGAAAAQPVATAQGRADELSTARQIDVWTREAPSAAADADGRVILPASSSGLGAVGLEGEGADRPTVIVPWDAPPIARSLVDGRIHGEVGAEYGNRGYGGYAVASGPLGPNGAVQVGVSDFQGTDRRRGGYGSGYGYGNGDHKSLSVVAAFDFSHDRRTAAPSPTGAPAY